MKVGYQRVELIIAIYIIYISFATS